MLRLTPKFRISGRYKTTQKVEIGDFLRTFSAPNGRDCQWNRPVLPNRFLSAETRSLSNCVYLFCAARIALTIHFSRSQNLDFATSGLWPSCQLRLEGTQNQFNQLNYHRSGLPNFSRALWAHRSVLFLDLRAHARQQSAAKFFVANALLLLNCLVP